jgi:hypothetical protein
VVSVEPVVEPVVEPLVELDPLVPVPEVDGSVEPPVPAAPDVLPEVESVAPPLMEALPLVDPDAPGVVALLLLEEPGVVVSIEDEEELGEDGVVVAVGLDVVLLVPDLLRSQPVTAAVATASTATRGMSLFMTSPFDCGYRGDVTNPRGPGLLRSNPTRMHEACQRRFPSENACGEPSREAIFSGLREKPSVGSDRNSSRSPPGRVGAVASARN